MADSATSRGWAQPPPRRVLPLPSKRNGGDADESGIESPIEEFELVVEDVDAFTDEVNNNNNKNEDIDNDNNNDDNNDKDSPVVLPGKSSKSDEIVVTTPRKSKSDKISRSDKISKSDKMSSASTPFRPRFKEETVSDNTDNEDTNTLVKKDSSKNGSKNDSKKTTKQKQDPPS